MTTIGMQYDVLPGKERQFVDGFLRVLDVLKTLDGHVESHLYEDVQSRGTYMIFSRWKNVESFQNFILGEAFARTVQWGKEEILRAKPRHKIYLES